MKYSLIILSLLIATSAHAELDPFSVYSLHAPSGCLDAEIGTEKLTLADLIEIGLCNNPSLNKGFMSVKSSEAEYGAAKSEYLPSLAATGSISADYSKNEYEGSDQGSPYSGSIALDWLLFDFGGRNARTEQTKAYLDAAGFTYNVLLQDTILSITKAYYTLLSNKAVLESAKISEKSFLKSYEESKKRYELGLVPLNDKLLAQTSYEQSKLTVIEADNAVQEASGNLAILLNLPPDTVFDLFLPKRTKDIIQLNISRNIQELIDMAVEERSEIKSKYKEQEAAKYNIDIAKSTALPSVSVGASISGNDNWRTSNPYQYGTSVGLQLSVPLFTGFKNTYNITKAQYDYEQANYGVTETIDTVKNEVWNAWQNYKTAFAAYDISKNVLESAKENQRVAFASYEVGRGSILNLLTAESQLAEARQENASAFYNVLIAKANLYRTIGRF